MVLRSIVFLVCIAGLVLSAGCAETTTRPAENPDPQGINFSTFDPQVDELLARMELEEKIGQMTQPDQASLEDISDIETYFIGSVLSGGNSDPAEGNGFEDWRAMYDQLQARALRTRLKIPLLYGVDAVHGHSNVIGAVIFPHNIGLGCTKNPELVEKISRATAVEVKATGINWTFAPCVTIPRDIRWGRAYEGFSEDPEIVRVLGAAAVRGLQGGDLSNPLSVLACAKHYLGDGGTAWGTGMGEFPLDRGDTKLDEETLRRIHLPGYHSTIREGVGSIMPSYSSWNGEKLSGHSYLLTTVLKEELGFQGFLISDYNAIEELPGDYREQIKKSVNAGMDMFMIPSRYREFFETLKSLVEEGEVSMERIDDAVRRILRVKFAMGLFEGSPLSDPALAGEFGSAVHRELGREAVRETLVLLKNEESVLPLAKSAARIHLSGRGADNIGMQCGGWTIEWQGGMGEITEGTTIREALEAVAEGEITYSEDGSGASGADVAVVVIGEEPYAEMEGDREDLELAEVDVAAVRRAAQSGVPTVVVLLTGRPMILDPILEVSDAIVAAWWPGTEGLGIADVLFGDYAPTGKLSFSWPRSVDQLPSHIGDEGYDPLFPLGHGLGYK